MRYGVHKFPRVELPDGYVPPSAAVGDPPPVAVVFHGGPLDKFERDLPRDTRRHETFGRLTQGADRTGVYESGDDVDDHGRLVFTWKGWQ